MRIAWALALLCSTAWADVDRGGACLSPDSRTELVSFTAAGNKVTFCLENKAGGVQGCFTVDLTAGTWRWPSGTKRAPATTQVVTKEGKASWCVGDTCVAIDVPPREEPYPATLSPDGKRLAVVIKHDVVVVEIPSGKRLRTVTIGDATHPLSFPAEFAGDAVYAVRGVSMLAGWFVLPDDTRIVIDNVAPGAPVHIGGSRWAVTDALNVSVVDVADGGTKTGTPHLPDLADPKHRSEVCTYCVGGAQNRRATGVAVLGSGDLVGLSALGLVVFDPQTLAPKRTLPFPICAPTPPGHP